MRVPLQFGSGFRRFTKHIKKKRRPPTAATVTLSTDGEFDDVTLCDQSIPFWLCLESLLGLYRVTRQVVPKLSAQGRYGCNKGPESRLWEQPDLSPCIPFLFIRPGSTSHGGKGSANGSIRSDDEIDGDNINVVVRVRPLNSREIKNDDVSIVQFPGDGGIWVRSDTVASAALRHSRKLVLFF